MTIETGKMDNEEEQKSTAELTAMVLNLTKELAELKKNGNPQVSQLPGGMSLEQFTDIIKAVKERPDVEKFEVGKFVAESDIPKDDYDEKGVIFCAYSTGYVIVDDVRKGLAVRTPYGNKIFFMYQASKRTRGQKGEELNTYSQYVSHSKREQQWLRDHRFFGAIFFESAKEALSVDAQKAQRLLKFINALMAMDQHGIVKRCREYSVPISDDFRVMRIKLAYKMVEREMDEETASSTKKVEEQFEGKIFEKK